MAGTCQDSLAVVLSGLEAISVPPPGLADLRARLAAGPGDPRRDAAAAAGSPASLPPQVLGLDSLGLDSLGLDSLGRMEFCIQLELDHGVPLTPDRLAAMRDLGELLAFIEAAAPPPAPPPAA